MDSLLANYASSDDEGEAEKISHHIPPPKSSLFSSLPPPKSQFPSHSLQDYKTSSSSTFSSLPVPKSHSINPSNKPSLDQNPKKVVHFTLPLNPSMFKSQEFDEDDDEEDKGRKNRKDASSNSTPKALASLLPAPKNTLCIAPAQSLGASRRSSLQTDAPSVNYPQELKAEQEAASFANRSKYCVDQSMVAGYENFGSYSAEQGISDVGVLNPVAISSLDSTYASNPTYTEWEQDNGKSFGYTNYIDNWSNVSSGVATSEICDIERIAGKRGRTDIPTEIMEVKQDELMKNRPREDQVKLTGIAFGPAYQPVPSAKGKPSKLQKRKHQIGSLYYDLKQKEMELAERRSRGLLTKSETQAKYGW